MTESLASTGIVSRGEEIYQQRIRSLVESQHLGQFLVLDIESGDYVIDADDLTASKQMLAKRPRGKFYGVRIGRKAAYRLGGLLERQP